MIQAIVETSVTFLKPTAVEALEVGRSALPDCDTRAHVCLCLTDGPPDADAPREIRFFRTQFPQAAFSVGFSDDAKVEAGHLRTQSNEK